MSGINFPVSEVAKAPQLAGSGALRIGEMLVAEKLLTTEQLNEAIEAQYLYGSRLGTSLVELGYIDEQTICKTLSRKLSLPYIEPEALMAIPEDILALVSPDLATKYLVVPCDLIGKKLYLAMADPTNLATIDELSFRLNLLIVPVVVSEIRLMFALYKFYQLKLTPRLQILSKHMLNLKVQKAEKQSSPWQEKESLSPVSLEEKLSGNDNLKIEKLDDSSQQASSSTVSAAKDIDLQPQDHEVKANPLTGESPELMSFGDCCNLLAFARGREEIAGIVLDYLGQEIACAAFLTVKSGAVVGWHAIVEKQPIQDFCSLTLALDQTSTLRKVVENRLYYLGPPTRTEQDIKLMKRLGPRPPEGVLSVPLVIKDRLIGLLYLQDNRDLLATKLDETHQLVTKIAMAFEILILRGKIRAV